MVYRVFSVPLPLAERKAETNRPLYEGKLYMKSPVFFF
jgi:hypothetical protein